MNRLQAGYCKMVNPYGGQIYTIDLTRENVDGFFFWTKNIGPFLRYLPEVQQRGYPFIVQHTINSYPRELEFRVINSAHTLEHMKTLSGEYGPDVAVWRYDPIVISSLTPFDWHRSNFAMLAKALEGTTNEVVISFAQIYKKTRRNMDWAAREFGFDWDDHKALSFDRVDDREVIRSLLMELAQIAQAHGMRMKVCSQAALLVPGVVEEARCIDADRLEKVSGHTIEGKARQKGNRKECACFASKDIGEYDTCPHGCVYCYAVQHRDLALNRYKAHDPHGQFLFSPRDYVPGKDEGIKVSPTREFPIVWKAGRKSNDDGVEQLKLF